MSAHAGAEGPPDLGDFQPAPGTGLTASLKLVAAHFPETRSQLMAALQPAAYHDGRLPTAADLRRVIPDDKQALLCAGLVRLLVLSPATRRQYGLALRRFLAAAAIPAIALVDRPAAEICRLLDIYTIRWILAGGSTSAATAARCAVAVVYGIPPAALQPTARITSAIDQAFAPDPQRYTPVPMEFVWLIADYLLHDAPEPGAVDVAALLLLLVGTLCRPGELLSLAACDVDRALHAPAEADGRLAVTSYYSKARSAIVAAETASKRAFATTIYVHGPWAQAALLLLHQRRREDGLPTLGGPISMANFRTFFQHAFDAAIGPAKKLRKMAPFRLYGVRAGTVTTLLANGVAEEVVRRHGRWTDSSSTLRAHYYQPRMLSRVIATAGRLRARQDLARTTRLLRALIHIPPTAPHPLAAAPDALHFGLRALDA